MITKQKKTLILQGFWKIYATEKNKSVSMVTVVTIKSGIESIVTIDTTVTALEKRLLQNKRKR